MTCSWLPQTLPPWSAVVLSTLPDGGAGGLACDVLPQLMDAKRGLQPADFLEVGAVGDADTGGALDALLAARGRRAAPEQRKGLLAAASGASMLQLKLLAGEVGARL